METGASFEVTPIGGGSACNCFASNQTDYCSASDPTVGHDCECSNKRQGENQGCQVNKRHKIVLKEKDSSHQCSIIIKSASKADSGLFKFYSNYGELISECSLVVNESPDDDNRLAFLTPLTATITVLLVVVVILSSVIIVKVRGQASHQQQPQQNPGPAHVVEVFPAQSTVPASAPSSDIELPLLNEQDNSRQVVNTGTNNDDNPARTCQDV